MLAGKKGADRQEMHEILRQHALIAWQAVQQGQPNPLIERLQQDTELLQWITKDEIRQLADLNSYTGFARNRAMQLVRKIREQLVIRLNKFE